MTTIFQKQDREPDFQRYREQWESALLSKMLSDQSGLEEAERRDLHKAWFQGLFNGHAAAVQQEDSLGCGELEWMQSATTRYDFVYTAPYGLKCSLGRVYLQPDKSWASLVIAGVGEDHYEAMAKAEWAISRLSS